MRSVHLGHNRRPAKVVWTITAISDTSTRTPQDFARQIADAVATITADGVPAEQVTVELDYDRQPDYDEDQITPKVKVVGYRRATSAEMTAERQRLDLAYAQHLAEEKTRLQQRLAELG